MCSPPSDSVTFKITLTPGSPGNTQYSRCLFDCREAWQVYDAGGGRLAIVADDRTFIINSDFSSGTLYAGMHDDSSDTLVRLLFPFDEILVATLLTRHPGIIAHACGIVDRGKGAVFVGASGNGKSTMARLWLDEPGSIILNDDRIVLRRSGKGYDAYGTPWHGEVPVCNQGKTPLERLFFLDHSDTNYVKPISPADAATRLIVRSFPVIWDRAGMNAALDLLAGLTSDVPCYELGFLPDKSCVRFIRDIIHPAKD